MSSRLAVRLTPGARSEGIQGWSVDKGGRPVLSVRVRARPVEGEANAALVVLIANALDLPRSSVRLERGQTSRLKRLEIDGLDETEIHRRLGA